MKISQRVQSVHASGIRTMFELARTLQNPIDLSLGVSDERIPQQVIETLHNKITNAPAVYSSSVGYLDIREQVAEKLRRVNTIAGTADSIILTHGLTGGLVISLFTILDPGDEVILIDPYFVLYPQMIELVQARPVIVPSAPTWRLPLEGIQAAITPKTKAIIINTPHNPTGAVYTKDELQKLVDILAHTDITIISDEIYEEYVYDGRKHISIGSMYTDTITLMAPSKSASLAGWRSGYLHAPLDYIQDLTKVQQIMYVCASTLGQETLGASLAVDYTNVRKRTEEKRNLVQNYLAPHTPLHGLEGSFYAFVPVPSIETTMQTLLQNNILVTPASAFSREKDYIRLVYAGNRVNLEQALRVLQHILQ